MAAVDSPNTLTIEQLAAQSGMTVRNIRAHQARGLLAPPEVRLRVGYYGPDHVSRLKLIHDLQEEGFNLNGIKRLLDDSDASSERLQRFKRALATPYDEPSEVLTAAELGGKFRVDGAQAPDVLAKAEQLGVLVARDGGGYEVPSPSLLAVAEEVVSRGISVLGALAVFEELERHCDAVARAFVRLFVREVWRPFQADDMPPERWPEIDESIERLGPLASDALLAIFQQRMRTQIESAFGDSIASEPGVSS
jgi:DNA-binding transcriptional MerR regulator